MVIAHAAHRTNPTTLASITGKEPSITRMTFPIRVEVSSPQEGERQVGCSGEHFAGVDRLDHGAKIVPMGLREFHVTLDRLPV